MFALLLSLTCLLLSTTPSAEADRGGSGWGWVERTRISPGTPVWAEELGTSASMSGDTILLGAPGRDHSATNAGAAYVFVRAGTGWAQQARLTADDAAVGDRFGISVSVWSDTAVVGAYQKAGAGTRRGAAYVFERIGTGWSQKAKLIGSDTDDFDYFGRSVAVSDDTVLVGSFQDYTGGVGSGSAYVFVRGGTGWAQQAKLTPSSAYPVQWFGNSVALVGDVAAIGSPFDDSRYAGSGSAYVFARSGTSWVQEIRLEALDADDLAYFGTSVALSGQRLAVGAPGDDHAGVRTGAAYVFVRSGSAWAQEAKLTAGDAAYDDAFGESIAIVDGFVAVGAPKEETTVGESGSVYVFVNEGGAWREEAKLADATPEMFDEFGKSVAFAHDRLVVGSFGDDHTGPGCGSGFVFERVPTAYCTWYCGAGTNLDLYTVATGLVLGGDFEGTVAITPPNVGAVVAGYLGRLTFPLWLQEGLVDLAMPEVMGFPSGFGSSPIRVGWPVPNDSAYVGHHVYTQAAGVGGGVIRLTCAFDCAAGY
jgi:hypothetical protein